MPEYSAGKVTDYADGDRKVVECGEMEVGVFRIGDEFFAWHNRCAHRAGPICQGRIMKRVIEPVADDRTIRTQHTTPPRPTSSAPGTATNSASGPDCIRATAACGCARPSSPSGMARSMSEPERRAARTTSTAGSTKRPRSCCAPRANWSRTTKPARVSDEAVAQILTAAIRLYVAKSDGEERTFSPIAGQTRQRDDADRAAVGGLRNAARAASRPDGACAVVSAPSRRGHLCPRGERS